MSGFAGGSEPLNSPDMDGGPKRIGDSRWLRSFAIHPVARLVHTPEKAGHYNESSTGSSSQSSSDSSAALSHTLRLSRLYPLPTKFHMKSTSPPSLTMPIQHFIFPRGRSHQLCVSCLHTIFVPEMNSLVIQFIRGKGIVVGNPAVVANLGPERVIAPSERVLVTCSVFSWFSIVFFAFVVPCVLSLFLSNAAGACNSAASMRGMKMFRLAAYAEKVPTLEGLANCDGYLGTKHGNYIAPIEASLGYPRKVRSYGGWTVGHHLYL